jgi:hypothetical protein
MATLPGPKRQMEAGQLYIPLWINGLHVNRSPLFTPLSNMGLTLIQRLDTLWGGSNMELTMQSTVARRPGFPAYDSIALPAGQIPDQFFSYQNLSGVITDIVDTQNFIYTFTPTSLTEIFAKSAGAVETSFLRVGNTLYMSDGVDFVATGYTGTIGTPTIVGIAVPTVAPTFTIGKNGFLLPTTGWTYGYSYENSTSGQVSTMSPISADTGDLDIAQVKEGSVTYQVGSWSASGGTSAPTPGTVVFGTPNGNNLWIGAVVNLQGFGPAGSNGVVINGKYTITAVTLVSFSASTAQWGTDTSGAGVWNEGSTFGSTPLTGITAVFNPITIPGSTSATPAVYTVNMAGTFSPTNAFDGLTATTSSITVVFTATSKTLTQIESGTPTTGQYVVNAGTGQVTFAAADEGKAISLSYAVTPTSGGAPVSFIVTGPSSLFSGATQTDTTGYSLVDTVVIYRSLDGDGTAGPWYFLTTIPNDIAIISATYFPQTLQTEYTFAVPHPAGANNGYAGAANTAGATIAGFVNSGNNGNFTIVGSSVSTIVCFNPNGVNEIHAATVNSGTWTYTDTGATFGYSFDYTVPDGELDTLIEAPIDDANNPPPSLTNPLTNTGVNAVTGAFSLLTYYAGRLWGAVDNFVFFAGGPDVLFGSPTESFPPANVFTFAGKVTAMAPMPAGLVVFTSDTMYIIYGTSTATFYAQVYLRNRGVLSQNCVVVDEQTLYIYTTQRQCFSYSTQETEIGFNVAPLFSLYFPPTSAYLTFHRMGEDVGLFISDGSVNYMKYRTDSGCWSPMCQIVGGANAFQSIETSNGVYTLLAGSATGGGHIYGRSTTSWTDAGGTYPCSVIVGSFIVSPPGGVAKIDYITAQWTPTGTLPVYSILTDEIATLSGAGPWVSLLGTTDPPKLVPSVSITQQRFYLKSANQPVAQNICNMMVMVNWPAANTNDQLLTLGIT